MPHTRGLADAFGDSVNGRSGAVAGIAAALWNREDESAALSPLPDRREVFAAEGPKDDFGSCIVEHDFEPRGVLDTVTGLDLSPNSLTMGVVNVKGALPQG
jgi:hypothetical protein